MVAKVDTVDRRLQNRQTRTRLGRIRVEYAKMSFTSCKLLFCSLSLQQSSRYAVIYVLDSPFQGKQKSAMCILNISPP